MFDGRSLLIFSLSILDQKDLAINFVKEYYKNPRRGYGNAVGDLFSKLRRDGVDDPLKPAREQFNGKCSIPIACFC